MRGEQFGILAGRSQVGLGGVREDESGRESSEMRGRLGGWRGMKEGQQGTWAGGGELSRAYWED